MEDQHMCMNCSYTEMDACNTTNCKLKCGDDIVVCKSCFLAGMTQSKSGRQMFDECPVCEKKDQLVVRLKSAPQENGDCNELQTPGGGAQLKPEKPVYENAESGLKKRKGSKTGLERYENFLLPHQNKQKWEENKTAANGNETSEKDVYEDATTLTCYDYEQMSINGSKTESRQNGPSRSESYENTSVIRHLICHTCPAIQSEPTEATHFCSNCKDYLCEDCAKFHCRTKLTVDHVVSLIGDPATGIQCEDDEGSDVSDEYIVINDEEHEKKQLEEYLKQIELKEKLLESKATGVRNQIQHLLDERNKTEKAIEEWANNQRKRIHHHKDKLLNELAHTFVGADKELGSMWHTIQTSLAEISMLKDSVSTLASENNVDRIVLIKALRDKMRKQTKKNCTVTNAKTIFNFVSLCPKYILKVERQVVNGTRLSCQWLQTFSIKAKSEKSVHALAMAISPTNKILVTDAANQTIKVFSTDGKKSSRAIGSTPDNRPKGPLDLAFSEYGHLMVSDKADGSVYIYDRQWKLTKILRNMFVGMGHIAVNSQNQIVTSDYKGHEITIRDLNGNIRQRIKKDDLDIDQFEPHYITCNSDDTILVTDMTSDSVYMINKDGCLQRHYSPDQGPSQLSMPWGICTDMLGQIIVVNHAKDEIHLLSASGDFLGQLLTKEDGLEIPASVAVDNEGKLYVLQTNGIIKVFDYELLSETDATSV